jgi:hypothetical protein
MRTSYRLGIWTFIVILAIGSGSIRAEDPPLHLIPAKSALVIQLSGLEKAPQKLGKLINNAFPDKATMMIQGIDLGLKEILQGRDTKGIIKDAPIFAVLSDFTTLSSGSPEAALIIPITGYTEFRDNFFKKEEKESLKKGDDFDSINVEGKDEAICLLDRKTHVIIASDKDVAKAFTKKGEKGLDTKISAESKKGLLESDASIYVNLESLNESYGAQLKGLKAFADIILNMGGAPGIDKKQIDMIKSFFNGLLQIFEDGVGAVGGVEFRPEGVNLKFMAQFGAKTETNNFLKELKPNKLGEMSTLPKGQMAYSGVRIDPKLAKAMEFFTSNALPEDDDEEAKKLIEKALQILTDAELQGTFSSANFPASGIEVSMYKNPEKAVDASLQILKALTKTGAFAGVPLKNKPEIKENAETVGKFKLHSVHMAFDFEKALEELPEGFREAMKASMARMVGEEMKIWFGTDGKTLIQLTAKDWKSAKALFDQYTDGSKTVAKDEGFLLTRKNLPAEATMISMIDTGKMVFMMFEMFKEFAQAVPGFPADLPNLKPVNGNPAYFGFAVILKAEHGIVDFFVPTTAVSQVRKLLEPILERDN